jgi:F0F1-type ATP synthase assembly protein I
MPEDSQPPVKLAQYAALSQVGMEMVVPIGVGALLDHWRQWGPWGSVCGAAIGLVVGIVRLKRFQDAAARNKNSQRQQGQK